MSSLTRYTFNKTDLFTVTTNGKSWTRAKEVCQALEYGKKAGNIIRDHCSPENIATKHQLSGVPVSGTPVKWPSDSQKHNLYINEEGMYELVFTSQQPKAKEFKKRCCNELFPQVRQKLQQLTLEEHQRAIEGHLQTIEELDAVSALLNDDLREREFENVGLQGEIRAKDQQIETLTPRYVPKRGDYDNILVLISKNRPEEAGKAGRHPYYMIRCQKQSQVILMSRARVKYPNMVVRDTCEDPNAIHEWCGFKDLVLEDDDYYRNHFSLNAAQRAEFEELFEMQI